MKKTNPKPKTSRARKKPAAPAPKEKSYSVEAISRATGADPKTIKKAVAAAGIKPLEVTSRGYPRYSLVEVQAVLTGRGDGSSYAELRAEQIRQQTRESHARADLLEAERKQLAGITVTMEEVQAMYAQALLPIRQMLMSMPSEVGQKANPTDPQFGQAAAQEWLDGRALPGIRDQLPKPTKGK